jgi:hypothetical protein
VCVALAMSAMPEQKQQSMAIGCEVLTAYGWGIVKGNPEPDKYVIELEAWSLTGKAVPTLYAEGKAIIRSSYYDIGSSLLTVYGTGVLFQYRREDDIFVIRLWRPHGQGSATAYMKRDQILRRTTAVTGCRVSTAYGNGYVNSYHLPHADHPIMFGIQLQFGIAFMSEEAVCADSVVVMPAADYLMSRMSKSSKIREIGEQYLGHADRIPIVQSMKKTWDELTKGDGNVNDILKDRAAQLKSYVQGIDSKSLELDLQGQVMNKLGHTGQLEGLLMEGKRRVTELIENADDRKELGTTTKDKLNSYLKLGIEQVDTAMCTLKEEAKPNEMKVIDGVISIRDDVDESVSVLKDMAKTDPVMQDIMRRIDDSTAEAKAKSAAITSQLRETKAVSELQEGAHRFTGKMKDLLHTAESEKIKDFGSRVMKSMGRQGEEKGMEFVDDIKNRVLKHLSQDEKNESVMKSIESRIIAELQKWQSGEYREYSNALSEGITSLTFMLGVISQGNASKASPQELMHVALARSAVHQDFVNSPTAFMWRKLVAMLVKIKEKEEKVRDMKLSGYDFTRQFQISPELAAKKALKSYAEPKVNKVTSMLSKHIDPKYADAAAPITALVSQIASGKFNLESAISAATESLNSKGMSHAAQELMLGGDRVVGALESFSNSDSVQLAMIKLQELDIEGSLGSQLSKINTKMILDEAEDALTNAEARNRIINNTKDQILEFLLENLPSMSVPDIQGVKDDIQFAVTGLDMSGFKLRKEDVVVVLGSSLNEEFLTCTATGIMAKFARVRWRYQQLYFPYLSGSGLADASAVNASIKLGLKLVRVPKGVLKTLNGTCKGEGAEEDSSSTSANSGEKSPSDFKMPSEPSIIDEEKFYKRYPMLRAAVEVARVGAAAPAALNSSSSATGTATATGTGAASAPAGIGRMSSAEKLTSASLPAKPVAAAWGDVQDWEPALVLSGRHISMETLDLNIEDSTLAWLYNLLASVFAGLIKEYVCNSLRDVVASHSAMLLGTINGMTSSYWPVIKQILDVTIEGLPIASTADVAALMGPPIDERPMEMIPREYTLKLAETGTLGLKMHMYKEEPPAAGHEAGQGKAGEVAAAGGSPPPAPGKAGPRTPATPVHGCRAVITGSVPGTQAERVIREKNLSAYYVNSTIIAVNGKNTKTLEEEGVLALLKGARPLFITIRLERRTWVAMGQSKQRVKDAENQKLRAAAANAGTVTINGAKLLTSRGSSSTGDLQAHKRRLKVVKVQFNEGSLGLKLKETRSCGGAVIITGFARSGDSQEVVLQAEASGRLFVGMLMLSVAGEVVFGRPFDEIMAVVKAAPRPVDMCFVPSPDKQLVFKEETPKGKSRAICCYLLYLLPWYMT